MHEFLCLVFFSNDDCPFFVSFSATVRCKPSERQEELLVQAEIVIPKRGLRQRGPQGLTLRQHRAQSLVKKKG